MTTVDLGRLTIDNSQILNFSITEIRDSVKKFLEEEFLKRERVKKKGKWAIVADKMRGTLTDEDVKYLKECSKEIRDGFELRSI